MIPLILFKKNSFRNQRVGLFIFNSRGGQKYNSHYERDRRKISPIHFPAGWSNRFFRGKSILFTDDTRDIIVDNQMERK